MFKHSLGIQVDRAESVLPQTVLSPGTAYYNVAGGKVLVTGLVGEIVTANVGGAVAVNWFHNATAGTDINICAATTITAWIVGDILVVTGLLTDTMLPAAHGSSTHFGGAQAGSMGIRGFIVTIGALGVISDASVTGHWIWTLWYIPITAGATVVATVP